MVFGAVDLVNRSHCATLATCAEEGAKRLMEIMQAQAAALSILVGRQPCLPGTYARGVVVQPHDTCPLTICTHRPCTMPRPTP